MPGAAPFRTYKLKDAAKVLHKSERWLWGWLEKNRADRFNRPFYRLAGRTKLFTDDDLARIYEAMPCRSISGRRGRAKAPTTKFAADTSESALSRALELAKRQSRPKFSVVSNDGSSAANSPLSMPKKATQ